MKPIFNLIKEADYPLIKDIYDYYVLHSTATFHTQKITIEELKTFVYINHPLYKSYIITLGQTVCGYCYLTRYKPRQAYDRTAEVTVYLKPEYLGRGYGKLALNHIENVAIQAGIKNLMGIITGDNLTSIKLFEKAGFEKCAHFKQVGEKFGKVLDVVAYQKLLAEV